MSVVLPEAITRRLSAATSMSSSASATDMEVKASPASPGSDCDGSSLAPSSSPSVPHRLAESVYQHMGCRSLLALPSLSPRVSYTP